MRSAASRAISHRLAVRLIIHQPEDSIDAGAADTKLAGDLGAIDTLGIERADLVGLALGSRHPTHAMLSPQLLELLRVWGVRNVISVPDGAPRRRANSGAPASLRRSGSAALTIATVVRGRHSVNYNHPYLR